MAEIDVHDLLTAAKADHNSVVELTRQLVRIPSRAGIDPYGPVLDLLTGWLAERGLHPQRLRDATGATVGLCCEIRGSRPGPRWVLDACLDTAPFGDEATWTHPPTSAVVGDGWLWGRGSADSKAAAAIFSHLATRIAAVADQVRGGLVLLFDVDEHTGTFGGAKTYFQGLNAPEDVAGVLIGYPGMDNLVVGGRGVFRTRLHVHGVAGHSGGSRTTPNAIVKAAQLVHTLTSAELPDQPDPGFPPPPKITVTEIAGGQSYSITPDLCTVAVDVRTTPTFTAEGAQRLLREAITVIDQRWPDTPPTTLEVDTSWPAYALPTDSRLRTAVFNAATALGVSVQPKIAGPSNIGNYLAGLGIPATAGFGVDHHGLHATNERIRLDTIPTVQAIYHATIANLMA